VSLEAPLNFYALDTQPVNGVSLKWSIQLDSGTAGRTFEIRNGNGAGPEGRAGGWWWAEGRFGGGVGEWRKIGGVGRGLGALC
jgi:hypothetical protein